MGKRGSPNLSRRGLDWIPAGSRVIVLVVMENWGIKKRIALSGKRDCAMVGFGIPWEGNKDVCYTCSYLSKMKYASRPDLEGGV